MCLLSWNEYSWKYSRGNELLEDVLNNLADKTSDIAKNIILLEIMGLVKSDGVYDEKEMTFLIFILFCIKKTSWEYESILSLNKSLFTNISSKVFISILLTWLSTKVSIYSVFKFEHEQAILPCLLLLDEQI